MKPLILLSNDDGYDSPGILALQKALQDLGELWVVAPHTEQSAVSSAITLWDPIRLYEHGERFFSLTGTPTDCAYFAMNKLLPRRPAICVSGINKGANLGDDVIFSGTVAAATQATMSGVPSLAVSLTSYRSLDFEAAAQIAKRVTKMILKRGLPRDTLLNLNVPKEAKADDKIYAVPLGRRRYEENIVESADPRDRAYYWIGGKQLGHDFMPGTDCNLNAEGKITLTPVQIDRSNHRFMAEVTRWLETE